MALSEHLLQSQDHENTFEDFALFIQQRTTLELAQKFIASLDLTINPRVFLSGFMIAKFPHDLLDNFEDDSKVEQDEHVLQAAKMMTQVISKISEPPSGVKQSVQEFNKAFKSWKAFDRKRQVERLSRALVEWKMTKEFLERSLPFTSEAAGTQEIIRQIEGLVKQTELRLQQIGGASAVRQAETQRAEVVDLEKLMEQNASELYWKQFGEEIERKEFHRVVLLLGEIRRRLGQLTPSNEQAQETVKMSIDVDFIKELIAHGAFDGPHFLRMFENIWVCIRNLQSAAQDDDWEIWKDEVIQSLDQSPSWSELLPRVFNRLLVQIDRIEELTRFYRPQFEPKS